jgi:hypothetical protein
MVIYIVMNCWLVGWNHGMDHDFPETVGNGIVIPTDELVYFSEGEVYHQPDGI